MAVVLAPPFSFCWFPYVSYYCSVSLTFVSVEFWRLYQQQGQEVVWHGSAVVDSLHMQLFLTSCWSQPGTS